MCQLCTFGKQGKASQDKVKSQPASILPRGGRAGAPLHPPVEHVAQGLVPDPRVHRGAGLPGNQVGSIVEKVDVHQVEGTAGSQTRSSGCRLELLGPPGRPPAIPPSSPGRSGQAARGKSSSEVDSEETHWAHALEPSHRKDPRTKVATSGRGTHRGYLELVSKQRSQRRVRSGEELGARPGLSSPHSWPCNLKPPWGPRGHWGVQFTLQKQPRAHSPWRALGKLRGHASCGPAGAWGGWGAGHPWEPWSVAGACLVHSRAGGWAPHPLQSWGHQALRPSLTAHHARHPRPEHTEEAPALRSGRTVTTEPGQPPSPSLGHGWQPGAGSGGCSGLVSSRPRALGPPPRGCPDCVRPQRGGRVDMGAVPRRSRSSQPAEQSQGRARWARMPGSGARTPRGAPSQQRGGGARLSEGPPTHAESAAGRGCGGHQRGPGCGLGLLATLRVPGIAGPISPVQPAGGRWGWPHGLRGTYQSARHHRVRRKPFLDHLH